MQSEGLFFTLGATEGFVVASDQFRVFLRYGIAVDRYHGFSRESAGEFFGDLFADLSQGFFDFHLHEIPLGFFAVAFVVDAHGASSIAHGGLTSTGIFLFA